MGCCGCLGFLKKRHSDVDLFLEKRYGGQCTLEDGSSYGWGGNSPTFTPGRDRVICREKPVKETTHLNRTVNAYGEKMINEYVRDYTIGRGSYGKVVLYHSSIDGKQYAIKAFYKSRLSRIRVSATETAMTDVLREVWIMKMIEHPNIINLIEVIDDQESDNFYMVLEYIEGRSICEPSGTSGGIGENTSRSYLRDIISGLMYLHSHDIVHGDIKPENLLVTRNGSVKIGDFSVSHAFEDGNDELCRSPGTPIFTAPECCLGSTYHGKAADTWAVGVTLYCMMLGCCPFIGDSLQETYDKILNAPLYLPEDVDPELKDLLQGLLCKDPQKRMKLDFFAKHPWVVRDLEPIPKIPCKCGSSISLSEVGDDEVLNCRDGLMAYDLLMHDPSHIEYFVYAVYKPWVFYRH